MSGESSGGCSCAELVSPSHHHPFLQSTPPPHQVSHTPSLPHTHTHTHTHSQLAVLNSLLGAGEVSLKIAVGQAIALLFELAERNEEDDSTPVRILWCCVCVCVCILHGRQSKSSANFLCTFITVPIHRK